MSETNFNENGETENRIASAAPVERVVMRLDSDEIAAAIRFCETCDDNEGYDIPRKMMKRLELNGLVIDKKFGRFEQTDLLVSIRDELTAFLPYNAKHNPAEQREARS